MIKPKFKLLIPGYETDLDINGTHDIGKVYVFSKVTAKDCDAMIQCGSSNVRAIAKAPAVNPTKLT